MDASGFEIYNHQKLLEETRSRVARRVDDRGWDAYEERRVSDVDHFTLCVVAGQLRQAQQFGQPMSDCVQPEENSHTYVTDGRVFLEVVFEDYLQASTLLPKILAEQREVRLFGQLELDNVFYVDRFEHLAGDRFVSHEAPEVTAEVDSHLSLETFASQAAFTQGAYLLLLFEHDFYSADIDRTERLLCFLSARRSPGLDSLFAKTVLVIHGTNSQAKAAFFSVGRLEPLQRFVDRVLASNRFQQVCLIPSASTDLYDSIPQRFRPRLASCAQQTSIVLSSRHLSFNAAHKRTDYRVVASQSSHSHFSPKQLHLQTSTLCLLSFDARVCFSIYY